MADSILELENTLLDIRQTLVSSKNLDSFISERDYVELGLNFLIEAGSYVVIAANFLSETGAWCRDEAIIGGNFVRLYKIICSLCDQICKGQGEIIFILTRLAFETIVNLSYLIKNNSPELFDSYVKYSLQKEKKLYDRVVKDIHSQGGRASPIQDRILNSICMTFDKSEVSIQNLPSESIKNWGNKNIYERAQDVGLGDAYLAVFGGTGSHSVHGNWMDLLGYHLSEDTRGFYPKIDWSFPRPQPLFVIAKHSVQVTQQFFRLLDITKVSELMEPRLFDFVQRVLIADQFHEKFLQK